MNREKMLFRRINEVPILYTLICLGVLLRLWQFGIVPFELNRDEAALGYNAYSVGNFGTDEWGERYPFVFKSFGDYKLPGYIYTLVPFVQLLGTSDWVIRLPSLLAGLGLIPLTYFFTRSLFDQRTALRAGVLVSLAPWAVFYGRNAYEANLALFFIVLVLTLIVKQFSWLRLGLLAIFYFWAVATYNTPLLLAPVLLVFTLLQKESLSQKIAKASVIFAIALLMARILIPVNQQKQGITVFSDPELAATQLARYADARNGVERMMRSRPMFYTKAVGERFLNTYLPDFLVFKGGRHPWHSLPGSGHMYITLYVLAVVGSFWLWKQRKVALWFLLLAASLPAIVTVDAPHATRSLLVLYILLIAGAAGWSLIPKKVRFFVPLLLLIHSLFFGYRLFVTFPAYMPYNWPHGIRTAVQQAEAQVPNEAVVIQPWTTGNFNPRNEQIYIHVLLETRISPQAFQQSVEYLESDISGMIRVGKVGRYIIATTADTSSDTAMIELQQNGEYVFKK